ncbi:hypothetical protein [Sphaerimonospora thailandensis]|uniref:WD40 repeat protein n=1 Tax=Sphaerimonospora thailandensis TaxID=795644 RepID=A0A8J3R8A8_9ACTN|nr:hypothetical protein [Sphaerimonospora thailandensis]GIH69914.1 hypothetical protein Mth01_21670 [Sphaerimonospora thailandensis]
MSFLVAFLAVSFVVMAPSALSPPVNALPAARTAQAGDDGERLLFEFRDPRVDESSGLAVSPTRKGIVYTHNDSGDSPRFFAVGMDGRTRATFTVAGAEARDWEAMAATVDPDTGRGVLWLGDTGDNNGVWPDISVYKVVEPRTMRDATLRATRYRFRYEDGPRDAEGLMVHPRTGRLYIVSKEFAGSVYAAPAKLRTDRVNVLRRVGPAPLMATDAAYAPDGSSFVIRTYFSASLYRAPGKLLAHLDMPPLRQAESITYTRDGTALLTGSEGASSPVYRVPLPPEARPHAATHAATPSASAAARTARPTPSRAAAATESGRSADGGVTVPMGLLWIAVAVGAIGVIGVIAYRTGR